MFPRFIVATDLSRISFAVVNCLGGLKAYGAEQCLLLLCLSVQEAASTAASYTTAPIEGMLEEQKQILEQQGFLVETRVVPGFAKREINRIAQEEDYSLIVVGSHGHGMIGEAFLGGVADSIIHQAVKPVLIVRLDNKPKEHTEPLRCDFTGHVLFPTDFSENADQAFPYVEKMVGEGAKRVTLLHVQDKTRIYPHLKDQLEEFNEIDRARLEKMETILNPEGNAEVDIELVYGAPFTEIMRVIRERHVTLVVMGSQGRGFIPELFLGSVSHNIARHSEAAVMLIPARRQH